jgi:hypothetical protein
MRHRIGVAGAIAYLAVVAGLQVAGGLEPGEVASSPGSLLSGGVWRLFSSGLLIAGAPVAQFAVTAVAVAAVLIGFGPGLFWRAAFAGHVLATLIAYAGVGVLWLVARADVETVVDEPDYGISCVLAGTLGALAGAGSRRPTSWAVPVAVAACVLLLLGLTPAAFDLTGVEHVLAFVLGGIVGRRTSHPPGADRG